MGVESIFEKDAIGDTNLGYTSSEASRDKSSGDFKVMDSPVEEGLGENILVSAGDGDMIWMCFWEVEDVGVILSLIHI